MVMLTIAITNRTSTLAVKQKHTLQGADVSVTPSGCYSSVVMLC